MWYVSPFLRTTGRLMSSSQPDLAFGPSAITGSPQVSPSSLSVSAMLFLGRQENHMRYRPPSRRTATSKHVPSEPPRTGLDLDFTHPAAVWASGCSGKATALVSRNPTSASNGTKLFMG